jgi:type I restriction-modification system DNA methylase subunit
MAVKSKCRLIRSGTVPVSTRGRSATVNIHRFFAGRKRINRAKFDEVKENEFNLNIPRYVDTFAEEEEIDIAATQKEIEKLEEELAGVRKEMKGYLKELWIVK